MLQLLCKMLHERSKVFHIIHTGDAKAQHTLIFLQISINICKIRLDFQPKHAHLTEYLPLGCFLSLQRVIHPGPSSSLLVSERMNVATGYVILKHISQLCLQV